MSRMNSKSGSAGKPHASAWLAVAIFCAFSIASPARAATATVTQSLSLQLNPAVDITVPGVVTLLNTSTVFNPFSNSLTIQYRVRSTPASAGASITVQAGSEFTPTGGPTVASGTVTFTCSGPPTACTGTKTLTTSPITILTVAAGTCTGTGAGCTGTDPNIMSVGFSSPDDPAFKTGSYTSPLTFTLSSN